MFRNIEQLEDKGKYRIGSVHQTLKGQIVITRRFIEDGVQMVEYAINGRLFVNNITNVTSNISRYNKAMKNTQGTCTEK